MRKILTILVAASFAISACTTGGGAATGAASSPSAAAAASFAADSTMGQIQAAGKLVCGTKFDVIAFGFRNPTTNEVEGFDADLCREIAAAIGVEPEFVEAISANRLPFLKEDKVDIIISTMTRNEERLLEIDFSKIYYVAGQKILVKSDSPHQSVEDLVAAKVKVCSGEGSTSEGNLQEKGVAQSDLVLFKTYGEAAQALLDGRCDAVSTDDSILFGLAAQNDGIEVRGEAFTQEPLGIGIKKGKDDLVQFINGVLDAMAADGRWKALYDKNIKPYSGAEAPEPPLDQ
jgi:aspartate/glutamate/glutamine transport system substrate-binding protein